MAGKKNVAPRFSFRFCLGKRRIDRRRQSGLPNSNGGAQNEETELVPFHIAYLAGDFFCASSTRIVARIRSRSAEPGEAVSL